MLAAGKPVTVTSKSGKLLGSVTDSVRMPTTPAPDAGDVVHLDFTPSSGKELKDPHFALVVSPREFNIVTGLAWMCPISTGVGTVRAGSSKGPSLVVSMMGTSSHFTGNIQVCQLRAVDFVARCVKKIDKAPSVVLQEVRMAVMAVVEPG